MLEIFFICFKLIVTDVTHIQNKKREENKNQKNFLTLKIEVLTSERR